MDVAFEICASGTLFRMRKNSLLPHQAGYDPVRHALWQGISALLAGYMFAQTSRWSLKDLAGPTAELYWRKHYENENKLTF
jgi:hypothetical protein